MNWQNYICWTVWICNARYITVLSQYRSMQDVIEAVQAKAEELGGYVKEMPLVNMNVQYLNVGQDTEYLSSLDETIITIQM